MLRTNKPVSAQRSAIMRAVRSRGNKDTELVLVMLLRSHRVTGWRRHGRALGRPDFIFPAQKVAVFVDGCFWHGCVYHCRMPKTNRSYWKKKIAGNQKRDRHVCAALRRAGWRVLRIWEHDLRISRQSHCLARIERALSPQKSALNRVDMGYGG
jgi:DNA mismatch endonuclease, patch repair protein